MLIRVSEVILSCTTPEQVNVANRYTKQAYLMRKIDKDMFNYLVELSYLQKIDIAKIIISRTPEEAV